jgi:hypothetical protein
MFKKLYLEVDSKVEPNLELINNTKKKMHEELKNRNKVRTMNFYKYASIAACLVIFMGVLSVNQKINAPLYESDSFNESLDTYPNKPSTNNSGISGNPFNTTFDSAMSSTASTSVEVKSDSFVDKIIDFFENIIQWFKELLF